MISIIKQPALYTPSANPIWLVVQSDNANVIYFNISIKVGDAVVSKIKIYPTPDAPTKASIDLSNYLKNFTSTPIDNSTDFYKGFDKGYLNYSIQIEDYVINNFIGEIVDGVFIPNPSYGAITLNSSLYIDNLNVVNIHLSDFENQYFDFTQYYINGLTQSKFLSTKPHTNPIYSWSQEHLYFLADSTSGIAKAYINCYKTDGTVLIYEEVIDVATNKLHRLNLSPKDLNENLGIDFTDVKRFEVYLVDDTNQILTEKKIYNCYTLPCNYEPVNIVWLNKLGGVDSFTFINPKENKSISRSVYKSNKYVNYNYLTNGIINHSQKTYNVSSTSEYTVNTSILNDLEFMFLTEMLASEQVYVQLTDGTLYPVTLKTTSTEVKRRKYTNTSLRFQLSFEGDSHLSLLPQSYLSFSSGLPLGNNNNSSPSNVCCGFTFGYIEPNNNDLDLA